MKWGKGQHPGFELLGACADAGAPNVLLGAPMDYSASFRPGSRFGWKPYATHPAIWRA